jgi:hypothetical protein
MNIAHTTDALLTEVERQKKYLDRLPAEFDFPLFNSVNALESQRRNGYRNTAAAGREIVDNAIEAGATQIHVVLERPKRLEKHQLKDSVSAVAFVVGDRAPILTMRISSASSASVCPPPQSTRRATLRCTRGFAAKP